MNSIRAFLLTGAVAFCAGGVGSASAQTANFDLETEGFKGETFTSGGITFRNINDVSGFYPDGQPFVPADNGTQAIIENSMAAQPDFPDHISAPNTLTFGLAFIPGENLTIGPLATATMAPASGLVTQADFDLIYYENGPWGGILVTVDALLNGQVVGTTSFEVSNLDPQGRDNPAARHLTVSHAGGMDSVRIYSRLNNNYTTIRGLVDNVVMVPMGGGGCYANCDQSTAAPVLIVADFTCFLQRFAAGESYANCDESTAAPVLNVADFTCFLQRFAAGCP
jgi:hypothetical protein